MLLDPGAPDFEARVAELFGGREVEACKVRSYVEAIDEARASNMPLGRGSLRADDFLPGKNWKVLASTGYICDDPYTGTAGVTRVADGVYRVTTGLATRKASSQAGITHSNAVGAAGEVNAGDRPGPYPLGYGRPRGRLKAHSRRGPSKSPVSFDRPRDRGYLPAAVARAVAHDAALPAGRVVPADGRLVWLVDERAASALGSFR